MHPIERLRYVARAEGAGASLLVCEAAEALVAMGSDPMGMVTACRRLIDRHPTVGPLWWLGACLMTSAEPQAEARRAGQAMDADDTPQMLASCLPDEATVVVLGWPEQAAEALRRRGDVEALVVDCGGDGRGLARALRGGGGEVDLVPDNGLGPAVVESDLVVLEAAAVGPDGFVATSGSRAAAAVAGHAGVTTWVVAGVGRVLPGPLWDALVDRLGQVAAEPWEGAEEVVPIDLAVQLVRPEGLVTPADAVGRADCPVAPELLRPAGLR